MKILQLSRAVEITMSFLKPKDERTIQAWFDRLRRWDEDEVVRKNSVALPGLPGIYMLKTDTDIRIFFRMDGNTIEVRDVATLATINAMAGTNNNNGTSGENGHVESESAR